MRNIRIFILSVIIMMLSGYIVGHTVFAQESVPADTEVVAENASTSTENLTFMSLLKSGGLVMWPLGLCSLISIGLIIYNGIVIQAPRLLRPDVVEQVRLALDELNFQQARSVCETNSCLITNILNAGFERVKSEDFRLTSIEKGIEDASAEEIAAHLQPINYLSVIATIAPMLGLLGTVAGMIKAFRAMALGGMGRPELLADNIGEALITTATGLIIGIPVMVAYFYFKNRYTGIVSSINRICGNLLEVIDSRYRSYMKQEE